MQIKTKKWFKILFLLLISAIVIFLGTVRYRALKKQNEMKIFVEQIINSVLKDTKFFKNNSSKNIILKLQNNRSLMSENYTVSIIDYTWGVYEAKVLFDNETEIEADVSFHDNKPYLSHFRRLKK